MIDLTRGPQTPSDPPDDSYDPCNPTESPDISWENQVIPTICIFITVPSLLIVFSLLLKSKRTKKFWKPCFHFKASLFCYNKKNQSPQVLRNLLGCLFCLPQLHKFVAEKVVALIFRKFPRIQDFEMEQSK